MHTTDVKLSAFRGFQPDHHLNNISLFHLIDFMFLFSKSGMPRLIHDFNPRFENHRHFEYFALVSKMYSQFWNFLNINFSLKRFIFGRGRRDLIIGKVNCMDDRPQWTTDSPWIFFLKKFSSVLIFLI